VKPLPEEDIAAYEALIITALRGGTGFTQAMLAGYRALLCSPEFLYLEDPRSPANSGGTGGSGDLLPLAQRVSYFLWDTRPDNDLLAKATSGDLGRPEVLRAEVDRLVDDPRFARCIANFTDYWLDLRNLRRDEPDIRLYPEYRFDDYLVESMGMETRAFVTAMVRENMPAAAIVDSDFVFANDRLARHYGLEPLSGHAVRKVPVPTGSSLGGLLTQAAIQKVTANGTNTSPVLRGAWVMTRLLGQPPPKPPESVPAVEPERYRGLEEGEPVTGIDRAGHDFSYRLSHPVDPRGSLPDGQTFADIRALKALLVASPRQLARNLLHQFTAYATGCPVRFSDRRDIEAILDACAADGYRVRDLLHGFVACGIFRGWGGEQP
jgi:hypothetical protein